jgi:hypothetical protein
MLGADDPTFAIRLVLGLSALSVLAIVDLVRHPHNPTRAKEYGFLFAVTGAAMAYGVLHDIVTYSISWEYFAVGKNVPEAADGFGWSVIRLALMASWSAGLFVGLVLLIANNPRSGLHKLAYRRLARKLLWPLGGTVGASVICGVVGMAFAPTLVMRLGLDDLRLHDPHSFVIVSSIHAGTYLGGIAGVVVAVVAVRCERKRLTPCLRGPRSSVEAQGSAAV